MKKIILSNLNCRESLLSVVEILRSGGVVLLPTETVYGLMTVGDNDAGKEQIIEIKQRPKEKLFQVLIDSLADAESAGAVFDERAKVLAETFWPGPMTLVVPTSDGSTVGLRMPDHDFVREVIRELGCPLAATSANMSGEPPVKDLSGIENYFVGATPDLVVDEGERVDNRASTVVSVCGEGLVFFREGAISKSEIEKVLN